jgi:hypothetical protein
MNGADSENLAPLVKVRIEALEELWSAVQEWRRQPLGYTPRMATAVERINNLEMKTSK